MTEYVPLVPQGVPHGVPQEVFDFVGMCRMCAYFAHSPVRACAPVRTHPRARPRADARAYRPHMRHMPHWRGFVRHAMPHNATPCGTLARARQVFVPALQGVKVEGAQR